MSYQKCWISGNRELEPTAYVIGEIMKYRIFVNRYSEWREYVFLWKREVEDSQWCAKFWNLSSRGFYLRIAEMMRNLPCVKKKTEKWCWDLSSNYIRRHCTCVDKLSNVKVLYNLTIVQTNDENLNWSLCKQFGKWWGISDTITNETN